MSEYIKREDAIRAIMEYIRDGCDESDEFIDGTYKAKLIIEEDIPSADVVEVVRCKDCKEWDAETHSCNIRDSYGWDYKPTDYCSYGEKK